MRVSQKVLYPVILGEKKNKRRSRTALSSVKALEMNDRIYRKWFVIETLSEELEPRFLILFLYIEFFYSKQIFISLFQLREQSHIAEELWRIIKTKIEKIKWHLNISAVSIYHANSVDGAKIKQFQMEDFSTDKKQSIYYIGGGVEVTSYEELRIWIWGFVKNVISFSHFGLSGFPCKDQYSSFSVQ